MKPLVSASTLLPILFIMSCSSGESKDLVNNSSSAPTQEPSIVQTQVLATPATYKTEVVPLESEDANADVLFVRAVRESEDTWTFHVTVSHPDTGWEDYADGWDVVTEGGEVLKLSSSDPFTRLLLHPHENEQPFTRSQSGIAVPDDERILTVRAHDIVHGFGGVEIEVDLSVPSGPNFEVTR